MNTSPNAPVESKVQAATWATLISAAIMTILAQHVFKGDVPAWVGDGLNIVVPAVFAFAAGWWAKHSPR